MPLNLEDHGEQPDGRSEYRIDAADEFLEISRQFEPQKWTKVLKLKPTPQHWGALKIDVSGADSAFVRKRVCTRATQTGRITLAGNTLKCVEGETVKIAIEEGKYAAVLNEHLTFMGNPTWIRPNHD